MEKNSTIFLTHSYFLRLDPKQWKLGQPYAPLGTLYAAALLRENGYQISFHDSMFAKEANAIKASIQQVKPSIFVIYDDGFNYLTKMCLTNMREAAFQMMGVAKEAGCKIIVSSSDATDHFEEYIEAGADFVIVGEAEISLLELVNALTAKQENLSETSGLIYKTASGLVKTAKRTVLKNLDSLPLPAWDLLDIAPYQKAWKKRSGYFSINIATTRGCPFKCNWCAKPIYGNRYNTRSPRQVIAEIKLLQSLFGFEHIWFCDDIFGLKPGWVQEFANLLRTENISIRFKIQSRADLLVQADYVQALAAAGCEKVWMGAESGSQKILDAMDKGITVQQIQDASLLLKEHGIKPCFFIQLGYLDETASDIDATIQMIHRLLPAEIGISVSYPLPGTRFYEKVKQQLQYKANWTDSDELVLMFQNNQSSSFYKQLHRYIHRSYRSKLVWKGVKELAQKPMSVDYKRMKSIVSLFYYAPASWWAKAKLKKLKKAI